MDQSKSEKLKEILNKKLSSEEIEKKLKKESENLAQKKELKEESTEKIREEVKKLEKKEKKEKIVIPSVRDKEIENKESNILLYLVTLIALLLIALTIYLFTKDKPFILSKEVEKKETILKTELIEETQKSEHEIKSVVNDKLSKVLEETKIEKAVEKVKEVVPVKTTKKIDENKNIEPEKIEEESLKEVSSDNKKEVVTKVVTLDKNNFKQYYNSSKFNSLKCYNLKAGNVFPDSKCEKDLKVFLEKNKDAIRFEVIPVIAEDDNTIFNKIKTNISGLEESFQDRVKEYMFRGLGRERVLETSWQIKDILGEDTVLTPTNYYVKSKKNNKGIIIKAYH